MKDLLRCSTKRAVACLAALMLASLLAACASEPASDASAPPPPSVGQNESPSMGVCDTDTVQYAIGEPFDEAHVTQWRSDSGARQVRVLRPGSAATMDHRPDRLNIHLGSSDIIESLRCG